VVTRVCVAVCVSVCLSAAACPHYCKDPDVTWGSGRGCPLVMHYWADLQSVHRFRCYDNIAPRVLAVVAHMTAYNYRRKRRTRNVSEYMLLLAVCLVWCIVTYVGPELAGWTYYAVTSVFSTNSLRRRRCCKPITHCIKSRDPVELALGCRYRRTSTDKMPFPQPTGRTGKRYMNADRYRDEYEDKLSALPPTAKSQSCKTVTNEKHWDSAYLRQGMSY